MTQTAMAQRIELRSINELAPYAKNPRTHSDAQVDQIAASILQFGLNNPILVDTKLGIIAGHGRLLAARKLGLDRVPVVILDHLTEAQKRAYIIADNKLALNAGWDEELLRSELAELRDADFDIGVIGFSDEELEDLLAEEPAAGLTDENACPAPPAEPVSQPGDLWLCGAPPRQHRVLCGDSTSAEASYMKHRTEGHTNTTISSDTRADWSDAFALVPSLEVAYVWHASKFTREVLDGLLRIGFVHHQQIIWNKGRTALTRTHYWFQHEPCWYVRK